jgi:hypothetical protein
MKQIGYALFIHGLRYEIDAPAMIILPFFSFLSLSPRRFVIVSIGPAMGAEG